MENTNPQPVSEQPQQFVSQESHSPGPSKTFVILLVAIIIVAVGAGAYFLGIKNAQPVSTPTLNSNDQWQTYTNSNWGFSIQYHVQKTPPSGNIDHGIFSILFGSTSASITIIVRQNTDNLSLDNPVALFNTMVDYGYFHSPVNTQNIKQITLGGIKAFRLDNCCRTDYAPKASVLTTIQNNLLYEIRIDPSGAKGSDLERMLSSLKFIIPSPAPTPYVINSTNIPGWKMYSNAKGNFTISYPSNFTIDLQSDNSIIIWPRSNISNQANSGYSIAITSHQNNQSLTYDNPKQLFSDDRAIESYDPSVLNTVTFYTYSLAGYKAVRADHLMIPGYNENSTAESEIKAIRNGIVYDIQLNPDEKYLPSGVNSNQMKQTFEKILSTFTFANQEQTSTDTSSWKTFDGGTFQIQYPSNWIFDTGTIYNPASLARGGNGGVDVVYKQNTHLAWISSSQTADQYVDVVQQKETNPSNPVASQFSRQAITINGLHAVEYTIGGEGVAGTYLVVANGNTVVVFGQLDSYPPSNNTVNAIINSFKFKQ